MAAFPLKLFSSPLARSPAERDRPMQRHLDPRRRLAVACVAAAGPLLLPAPALPADKAGEAGWVSLFNGKNLDGWVQRGGGKAKYRAEDGQIVGTTVPNTANSFLCTDKDYGDFILELEFKVDPGLNSGVQIRSHCFDEHDDGRGGGKTIKIPAGRVHGYQVEIDPVGAGLDRAASTTRDGAAG